MGIVASGLANYLAASAAIPHPSVPSQATFVHVPGKALILVKAWQKAWQKALPSMRIPPARGAAGSHRGPTRMGGQNFANPVTSAQVPGPRPVGSDISEVAPGTVRRAPCCQKFRFALSLGRSNVRARWRVGGRRRDVRTVMMFVYKLCSFVMRRI